MPRKSAIKKDQAIEAIPPLLDIATNAMDATTTPAEKRKGPSTPFDHINPTKFAATSMGTLVRITPTPDGSEPVWTPLSLKSAREVFKETGDIRDLLPSEDTLASELYSAEERVQRYLRKVEYNLASAAFWQDRILSLDSPPVKIPQRIWNLLAVLSDD